MNVTLVMFAADGSRRDFPLTKDRVMIGRTTHADLRIPLSSVSRKHCEFRVDGNNGVEVRDLKSSNGTYHNGHRVDKAALRPGDRVGIGPVQFTVVIDGQPRDIEAVPTILNGHDSASGTAAHGETQTSPPPVKSKPAESAAPLDASALAADVLADGDGRGLASADDDIADAAGESDADFSGSSGLPLAGDEEDEDEADEKS